MKKKNLQKNIKKTVKMMNEGADYWQNYCDKVATVWQMGEAFGRADAYATCAHFLKLLLKEDWETLNQYDYYGEN